MTVAERALLMMTSKLFLRPNEPWFTTMVTCTCCFTLSEVNGLVVILHLALSETSATPKVKASMYVCMYVFMLTYLYIYMYVYMYTYTSCLCTF